MLVIIVAPLLAGLLGLATNHAEDAEAYLTRLRFLMLGAALLGYASVAWFTWRRGKGIMRWITIAVGVVGVRIVYPIAPFLAALVTGWLEWGASKLSVEPSGAVIHYSMGVFVAAFCTMATLLAVTAVANVTRAIKWSVILAIFSALGFFDVTQRDWSPNPHPFRSSGAAPSSKGPSYWEVAEDGDLPQRTRVRGVVGAGLHAVWPRSGWAGAVREHLAATFRNNPGGTIQDRITELESALLSARPAD